MENKSGKSKITIRLGCSWTTILQIVFIVLKLCKVISWKWIWVLSPTWISLLIVIISFIIFIFICVLRGYIKKKRD